jgi:pimeloyl-ACP methyl ester carboxylesterase
VPVTVAVGDLDVPFAVTRGHELADRLPKGRLRMLPGMAHQPYLESPEAIAQLVRDALNWT